MLNFFLFYLFLLPLEYIQEKVPKGPTGLNYQTLSLFFLLLWLLVGQHRKTPQGIENRSVTSPLSLPLVLMLFWNFFCRWYGSMQSDKIDSVLNPTSANFSQFLQYLNGFLLFWIVLKLFHDRRRINWLLIAIVLSAPLVYRAFRSDMHGGSHFVNEMRARGPFVNVGSNELAAYFLYNGLFFLVYLLQEVRWTWQRVLYLVPSGLYSYGVLYSYSRGAWMSFIAGISLVGILRHRAVLAMVIVAAIFSPMWLPQSVIDRYNMTENEEGQLESSAQSRKDFWADAIKMWKESPIIGNGVGSFKARIGMDTHGVYHRTLAEQGVIGFAIFMWVWGAILFIAARLWLKAPGGPDRQYGFALLISTIALMIANIFGDRITHLPMIGQYWVLVGIGGRLYANMTGVAALDDEPGQAHEAAAKETGQAEKDMRLVAEKEMQIVQPAAPVQSFETAAPVAPKPASDLNVIGPRQSEITLVRPKDDV